MVTYKQINYLNHLNQQIKYPRIATWVYERVWVEYEKVYGM